MKLKTLNYDKWIKNQELHREQQEINNHIESESEDLRIFIEEITRSIK